MTTPFEQYRLTPEQVQAAIAQSGGSFQLPGVSPMASGGAPVGVDTFQPLTGQEQALGQAFAQQAQGQQAAAAEAEAMRSFVQGGQAHGSSPMAPQSSLPGVDWQPAPPQTQLRPPTVNPYAPGPGQAQGAAPPMAAYPRLGMRGGAGLRSPLPGMERDARARAADAEKGFNEAAVTYDEGMARQEQSAEDMGQARSDAAQQLAGIDREASFDIAGREELQKARTKAFEESTVKTKEEMQALSDQVANGKPKDSRSGVQKAVGLIAIALGGIGRGFELAGGNMGARNTALDLVQAGIERDMEQQREMLSNKRTALAAKQSELGIAREMFGATEQADRAAYLMRLDRYERDVQAAKNQGLSKEAIGAADSLIGQLQEKRAAVGMELYGRRLEHNQTQADQYAIAEYQQRRAAAAAAATAKWGRLTPGQLETLDRQGLLPAEGVEALNKARKGSAEVEKLRTEARTGKKLTEGEAKRDAIVAGGLDAYQRLSTTARDPSGRDVDPSKLDMPAYGVTRGAFLPDAVVPESHIQYRSDTKKLLSAVLRAESGSNIPDNEVELKMDSLGLSSGDETVRARALQSLLRDYSALDTQGRVQEADGRTQAASNVRPGAAR